MFVCDTSQEVHVLDWGRVDSIPACLVQWKPWLIVLLMKREEREILSLLLHCL